MLRKFFVFQLTIIALAMMLVGSQNVMAQPDPSQVDFTTIKVDELTDAQVRQFIQQAESRGMTMQELEAQALGRGMPYSEVQKLRSRIRSVQEGTAGQPERTTQQRIVTGDERPSERPAMQEPQKPEDQIQVFGYELFRRDNLSFEPSLNIPTPRNYTLGPGDELQVEVWGASQQSYSLPVSPEGQVRISNIGPVQVSGLTIEEASELIIRRLSGIYSGLRGANPNTFAQVSLGNVRSIKVTISGDAYMPGTYTLPAFATAFNALYMAGGPSARGSFRDIRIVRENEQIAHLDLYDFLLKGETKLNIRLRDEDLIFIGPYNNRATIEGEVIRPAIYELKPTETLAELIDFAGGFSASAYTRRLQIDRKTDSQRQMLNVEKELYSSFLMRPGDQLKVGEILEKYENRVSIRGAVYREGDFALTDGMTVKSLMETAEGLREDAFLNRAALYRLQDNMELEMMNLNLTAILNGTAPDIALQREDLLMISSVLELQEERTVRIMGEVQEAGSFLWAQNLTLGEVIRKAGGLKDAASLARVEVARRVSDRLAIQTGTSTSEVFSFPLDQYLELTDEAASFLLQPFDMIFVRRSPGYQTQQLVQVRGEVAFPGSYAISRKNERISDLVKRAGGINTEAYLPGATLIRRADRNMTDRLQRLQALEGGQVEIITDTLEDNNQQYIGINLERILSNPYSSQDLLLMEGDILEIPQQLQTVRMTGAVLHPTSAIYQSGRGVRGYVSRAGGFADNAKKGKVYVLHPNGSVDRTRHFLFVRSYPNIEPGSEIIVPQKPERQPRTLQETIAISSAITSLGLVIVTLINQF
ncbi:MAG: hypothetical protein EA361_19585 [Bacteroidetes bacterium]|nr:MAG: hypothetical protein EA361_19585 [Bacteroidota bacterium]